MKSNREQSHRHLRPHRATAAAVTLALALTGSMAQNAQAQQGHKHKPRTESRHKHRATTPLQALTGVIARVQEGKTVQVTAQSLQVAGPIGIGAARPIEFSDNGKKYLAYAQEQGPNFREKASTIAGSMAIVEYQAPQDNDAMIPLDAARLDGEVLVDARTHEPVGFSVGGDSS